VGRVNVRGVKFRSVGILRRGAARPITLGAQ
jgi:hypothetical protein